MGFVKETCLISFQASKLERHVPSPVTYEESRENVSDGGSTTHAKLLLEWCRVKVFSERFGPGRPSQLATCPVPEAS